MRGKNFCGIDPMHRFLAMEFWSPLQQKNII